MSGLCGASNESPIPCKSSKPYSAEHLLTFEVKLYNWVCYKITDGTNDLIFYMRVSVRYESVGHETSESYM
jgi:hypothetical protein